MKKKSARLVALEILQQCDEKKAYSNLLLNHTLEQKPLSARDRGLVTELVYGVIQRLRSLDWIIDQLVRKGVDSLQPWVRQVLRMGLYQLMYLDKIPEHAAVNEMVQIAKHRGHQGIAKLVNGVLRTYLRQKDHIKFPNDRIAYSYPDWLATRMEKAFGKQIARQMMQSTLQSPKVSVRINRLKTNRDQWMKEYSYFGSPSMISEDGFILEKVGNPVQSDEYHKGYYTIQDESSMLVAQVLNPLPGMKILDACAAPGGKTTHIAERMENQGCVLACDLYPKKLALVQNQANRLGIEIIQTEARDMRDFRSDQQFDAILLDAPCSGFGVIRRKPEIKWRRNPQEIGRLVELQQKLLHVCAAHLKPGGVFVYSTCTWEPAENQKQIENFLAIHSEFQPDDSLKDLLPEIVNQRAIHGNGWVQILPHHFQSDGFFIVRLKKQIVKYKQVFKIK